MLQSAPIHSINSSQPISARNMIFILLIPVNTSTLKVGYETTISALSLNFMNIHSVIN